MPGRARLIDDGHEHVHEHVNDHDHALIPMAAWERTHLACLCQRQPKEKPTTATPTTTATSTPTTRP